MQSCSINGCTGKGSLDSRSKKRYFHGGYCEKHRVRKARHGDPTIEKVRSGEHRIHHELYGTYSLMKGRCYNPNRKEYKNYGGRGIYVDSEWLGIDGFTNFIKDMGERPEGTTLDRIDNNGPYSKSNCRWATRLEQRTNSRPIFNKTGFTGVSQNGSRFSSQWRGQHIGTFDTALEAYEARIAYSKTGSRAQAQ